MFLHIIIVYCVAGVCGGSFLLTLTPLKTGNEFQQNISLECGFWGSEATSNIRNVSRITLLKEEITSGLVPIAGIENRTLMVSTETTSAQISGNTASLLDTFLRLTWPVVNVELFEKYVCEVVGFDSQNNLVTERSPMFAASEVNITMRDILEILITERREQRTYCERRITETNISSLNQVVKDVERNTEDVVQLSKDIVDLYHHPMLQYWPEGSYALLMPDSGCPLDVAAGWSSGYRRFHTESEGTNHNNMTDHSHLMKPITLKANSNYYFYQHFCVLVDSPGHAWPNGSYCINRKNGSCPSGLQSGFIYLDEEDTGGAASVNGSVPDGVYKAGDSIMYYCCRSDGSPGDPIELPTLRPFYLYRYNGTCQEVKGMSVSDEEMTLDTEDFSNDDKYENEYHPDGQINNVVIHLCYYSRL
ncbi:hypothetical protein Btru_060702 [Bulinus truncatus]|nr:hypothetical protein Btru_060702 [Bulinus truncatus]